MNPLFIATPTAADISVALGLWPELAGKRIRPLLVSAFGDIYIETEEGEALAVRPLELDCIVVADSVKSLQEKFLDAAWSREQLLIDVILLAQERGLARQENQVFAVSPHPVFGGQIRVERLMAMDLPVWHHVCSQIKLGEQNGPPANV